MITFDSFMLKELIDELSSFLNGAVINKIQQPTRREIILTLRNNKQSKQFYINIHPNFYHVCFTNENNKQKRLINIPKNPPMFCMLLRKYLTNAKIAKINIPKRERILEFYFGIYNEIGDKVYLCLAIELMGKYSNIILYNTDTNLIIGCAHNVGADKSSVREVYGQIPYTYPQKQINDNFTKQRYGFLFSFKKNIYPENLANDIIDNYYSNIISKEKFITKKTKYKTIVSDKLKKISKSLEQMQNQILIYSKADKYRLYADIIMANLYNLEDFISEADVYDYENNCKISISLDSNKTLKENANNFYKKYNKSKSAIKKLEELVQISNQNKIYLENLLFSINISKNINDLDDISEEIETDNHSNIKSRQNNKMLDKILSIQHAPNTHIFIGRNNKQNDYIISKLASDEDFWFHTKGCAGSHVLLKTQNITEELILKCAKLAKQYSSASESSKVGVIYTRKKYLRKPPKANLGYVTYKNEKEILV